MKIKVCTDQWLLDAMMDTNMEYWEPHWGDRTRPSDYCGDWHEEDVDEKTLSEYIKNGYSIKINC